MKILVVKRDKVGDMLLATPMLKVLREGFPGAAIEVLASDYNAWVLASCADVDRIHTYRRVRLGRRVRIGAALEQIVLWAKLRARRYDVAIAADGEASPRGTRRALLAGARRTIAYATLPVRGLTDALPGAASGHERDRLLRLLTPLGLAIPVVPPEPRFLPSDAILDGASQWLKEQGIAPRGHVVIGLGSRRARRQPVAAQVLRWGRALRDRHGLETVFMWTPGASSEPLYPGDDAAAAEVLAARAPFIHPFRGPLQPAVGLAWLARTSVFPDSGLMHLAAASPGGVLGLFADPAASPPPERWGPVGDRAECLVAERQVADLPDEEVFARLELLLARPAAAGR